MKTTSDSKKERLSSSEVIPLIRKSSDPLKLKAKPKTLLTCSCGDLKWKNYSPLISEEYQRLWKNKGGATDYYTVNLTNVSLEQDDSAVVNPISKIRVVK